MWFYCFVLVALQCLKYSLTQGCGSSERDITIIIDSSKDVTPKDFELQKSFIRILLNELNHTKLKLTVQVYSNQETCQRFVTDLEKSIRLLSDRDKIRSGLDTLKYGNSAIDYNFDCVKSLADKSITSDESYALLLAKNESVKSQLVSYGKVSANSNLVCFVVTKQRPIRIFQMPDVQNNVLDIRKLICGENETDGEVSSKVAVHVGSTPAVPLTSNSILTTAIVSRPSQRFENVQSSVFMNDTNGVSKSLNITSSLSMSNTQQLIPSFISMTTKMVTSTTESLVNIRKEFVLNTSTTLANTNNNNNNTNNVRLPVYKSNTFNSTKFDKISLVASSTGIFQNNQSISSSVKLGIFQSNQSISSSVKLGINRTQGDSKKSSLAIPRTEMNVTSPTLLPTPMVTQSPTLLPTPMVNNTIATKVVTDNWNKNASSSLYLSASNASFSKSSISQQIKPEPSNNITRYLNSSSMIPLSNNSGDANLTAVVRLPQSKSIMNNSSINATKHIYTDINSTVMVKSTSPTSYLQNTSDVNATEQIYLQSSMISLYNGSIAIGINSTVMVKLSDFNATEQLSLNSTTINSTVMGKLPTWNATRSLNLTTSFAHPLSNQSISVVPSYKLSVVNQTSIHPSMIYNMTNLDTTLTSQSNSTYIKNSVIYNNETKINATTYHVSRMNAIMTSPSTNLSFSTTILMYPRSSEQGIINQTLPSTITTNLSLWLPGIRQTDKSFASNQSSTRHNYLTPVNQTSLIAFATVLAPQNSSYTFGIFATKFSAPNSILSSTAMVNVFLKTSIFSTSSLIDGMVSSTISASPSLKVLQMNSSSLFIPPIKKLTKDIRNFIEQDISNDTFNDPNWFKNFIEKSSGLLDELSVDNSSEVMNNSLPLVQYLENVALDVARHTSQGNFKPQRFNTKSIIVEVVGVDTNKFKGYSFTNKIEEESIDVNEKEEGVYLPQNFFKDQTVNSNAVILTMQYEPLPVMQHASNEYFEVANKVYVVNVDPPLQTPFQQPFQYVIDLNMKPKYDVQCVYWKGSSWDNEGCQTIKGNGTLVTCQCNHMTPFSVLMQVKEYEIPDKHRFALSLITYIGCGLSVAACLILILSFMMCGSLVKIDRNMIHINLAIAIAISNALFIVADSVYKYKYVCLGVSIAMLYAFLSSFFWMLVEGMHVYLMVVKVFKSTRKMKVYLLIGWFLPAVIVTLAGVKYHPYFVRPNFCWISTDHFLIWIFVGPALFVLTVNTIILIATLSASHKMCLNEVEFNKLRQVARLTLLLMPVFGLSWVFGVLAVNKKLIVFQYIFTGLNSFQGVFLFVCYCLMNNEVRREYARVRRKSAHSSKSNGLADSAFSTYIHYTGNKPPRPSRSSALSTEDVSTTVLLTRYDQAATNEDVLDLDENGYPDSVSNTLTKRHKKNYSIELVRLPNAALSDEDELQDPTDVTNLLTVGDDKRSEIYRSSTFSDHSSRHDRVSSVDDLIGNDGAVYKTFQNQGDGTYVTAYQV